jgi:hypothetical protein
MGKGDKMDEKGLAIVEERSVGDVRNQVNKIQELMKDLMKNGEHYGIIPGTGTKPSLLKAGAEKLCFAFRLAPEFDIQQVDLPRDHREIRVVTTLRNMATGAIVGQGLGSCSTMETKYRWRKLARTCPKCGQESIIKGKEEYGGGWLCWQKKGGCGAKFPDESPDIIGQPEGKIENEDIADCYNTVLKMAKKRSIVDATITACAASDIFTQDVEDLAPEGVKVEIVDDDAPDQHGEMHGAARPAAPAAKPNDPLDEARNAIKAEINNFITLSSSEYEGKAYFTDEEKVFYKGRIAAINEGAKAEKDLAKGLQIKLKDLQTLNAVISEELEKRKGNTPLAQAMTEALKGKNAGEQPEIF